LRIITIPFSGGSLGKNPDTSLAPEEILKELDHSSREDMSVPTFNIHKVHVEPDNFSVTHENVEKMVDEVEGKFIAIGGDHSLTYPLVKAFAKHNDDVGLIIFDAHPDLMQEFKPATHENYLRVLIEEGHVKPDNVILIGLRVWDPEETEYLKQKNIKHYTMKDVNELGMQDLIDAVMEQARDWGSLYISVDIDAMDPAFAPGTGYCEPGGMSSRDLIYAVQRLKILPNYKAADLVEVSPTKDVNNMTVNLAAKIVRELS
jgi:agmatinase